MRLDLYTKTWILCFPREYVSFVLVWMQQSNSDADRNNRNNTSLKRWSRPTYKHPLMMFDCGMNAIRPRSDASAASVARCWSLHSLQRCVVWRLRCLGMCKCLLLSLSQSLHFYSATPLEIHTRSISSRPHFAWIYVDPWDCRKLEKLSLMFGYHFIHSCCHVISQFPRDPADRELLKWIQQMMACTVGHSRIAAQPNGNFGVRATRLDIITWSSTLFVKHCLEVLLKGLSLLDTSHICLLQLWGFLNFRQHLWHTFWLIDFGLLDILHVWNQTKQTNSSTDSELPVVACLLVLTYAPNLNVKTSFSLVSKCSAAQNKAHPEANTCPARQHLKIMPPFRPHHATFLFISLFPRTSEESF